MNLKENLLKFKESSEPKTALFVKSKDNRTTGLFIERNDSGFSINYIDPIGEEFIDRGDFSMFALHSNCATMKTKTLETLEEVFGNKNSEDGSLNLDCASINFNKTKIQFSNVDSTGFKHASEDSEPFTKWILDNLMDGSFTTKDGFLEDKDGKRIEDFSENKSRALYELSAKKEIQPTQIPSPRNLRTSDFLNLGTSNSKNFNLPLK